MWGNACNSTHLGDKESFVCDSIYKQVNCLSDTTVSYSLYIPDAYSSLEALPVLILFDPHADGVLPLKLFRTIAKKHKFIIAVSNNSKNGLNSDETTSFCIKMLEDLQNRFKINPQGIYLGGFSGGARVAHAASLQINNIAGLVCCGAGISRNADIQSLKLSMLLVAGTKDFNLTELMDLDAMLTQSATNSHHLEIFNGAHEWPKDKTVVSIFEWLTLDAMRQKILPSDRKYIDHFIESKDLVATNFEKQGKLINQLETYSMMSHYLNGLTDISPLNSEIERLKSITSVKEQLKTQKVLQQQEQEMIQKYAIYLQNKDLAFWKTETEKLKNLSEQKPDTALAEVYKRILGHLSLSCYMYSSGLLKQGELVSANHFINLYQLVDPENNEHQYMAAELAMKQHKPEDAIILLKQSISLGFNDKKRLLSDSNFISLHQDKRFIELLNNK